MIPFEISNNTYTQSCVKSNKPDYVNFPDFFGISVSDNWGRNSERFIEELKIKVKIKFPPQGCDTIKSVVDHEIGHQLDKLLGISEMQEIRALFDVMEISDFKNMLSSYA
ncbi:MAG: hypothetical protein K2H28_07225 [Ruminococcus sp.]|nr:hypothetical protein [Ruminococcus sp.]